ncbi:hypothetical protein QA596_06605 [Balneolales bacterium ANBcel1]|nr:hypothetical protein [Balneolales bacterium ANBcel1]
MELGPWGRGEWHRGIADDVLGPAIIKKDHCRRQPHGLQYPEKDLKGDNGSG